MGPLVLRAFAPQTQQQPGEGVEEQHEAEGGVVGEVGDEGAHGLVHHHAAQRAAGGHDAERGAERCLAHLGLENGSAAKDIRELRDLLEAWRDARRTAWQTTIKVVTTGILAALLVGAAIKLKLMGGVQ